MYTTGEKQKEYWEKNIHVERRHPSHPVIRAFSSTKIEIIRKVIRKDLQHQEVSELSVLDVGAGNGFFTYYLPELSKNVSALDFSETMLAMNPAENKLHGDVNNLELPDNSFDLVFCSNLLHHVQNPQRAIDEMARVSKRYLILSEPNRNHPLMYLFGLLKKEERGTLKFSKSYLNNLLKSADPDVLIIHSQTQGAVLPNKTPLKVLPLIRAIEPFLFPRFYILSIARKNSM